MSERTLPSATHANRDVWSLLWHALASQKTAAVLLVLSAAAVLLTLLFSPQRPDPSAGAEVLARWAIDAKMRFGPRFDTLLALGLLSIGRAVWLRVLLAGVALTLTVGLTDTVAQVARAWRHPDVRQAGLFSEDVSGSGEWQVAQERATLVEVLAERLAWPASLPWHWLRIRPHQKEAGQVIYLYQDWLTWRRIGMSVLHLGLILILAGVALNARLGWRQEGIMLMPGETLQLAHRADFSLRLESVERLGAAGQLTSRIVLDGPAETWTGSVAVTRPYAAHGTIVYQRDFGPILRVSARDANGPASSSKARTPIPLADAATDMEPAAKVRLLFTRARAEQYLFVPDIGKVVRLVLYRHGETWDARYDELQIEIYGRDPETPEARGNIVGDGQAELNGIVYELAWEQYAVLDIVRSPHQGLVRMGMGLGLLGLLATLVIPSARLWVRIVEDKGTSVVRLTGEVAGGAEALASWRRRLGGGDANG